MHNYKAREMAVSGSDVEDTRHRKFEKISFVNPRNQFCCRVRLQTRNVVIVAVVVTGLMLVLVSQLWSHSLVSESDENYELDVARDSVLVKGNLALRKVDLKCRFHTCFDVYRCGYNENNLLSVYVYPLSQYKDEKGRLLEMRGISDEFYDLLLAIKNSNYYTQDRSKACIIIPSIDTLNQNGLDLKQTARILSGLPSWKDGGKNHLIFNMLPGGPPDYNTSIDLPLDKALIAGGGFASWAYRPGFDVSIPVFNALTNSAGVQISHRKPGKAQWLFISMQINFHKVFLEDLENIANNNQEFLVLRRCPSGDSTHRRCHGKTVYDYPQILQHGTFCLVIRGARLGQTTLMDALMMGCVPVVVSDDYILPFSDVLDWKRAAIRVSERDVKQIPAVLKDISENQLSDLRRQGKHLWNNYFSSMKKIALTTLHVINDRVYRHRAWMYEDWNAPYVDPGSTGSVPVAQRLFLPLMPPRSKGFTAVVLSYDRVDMMFKVLKKIAHTPSLVKIVVVWNNVKKTPPSVAKWPKLPKPVKVVQTKANKLSNRFYPYNEIETDAILAIDDDIVMLSNDELEFGFEVWREFPDRVVGFPGRVHLYDNVTRTKLKYDSEWTNDVSMVLTGIAFHHKLFSHVYTYMMPAHIRDWVDSHMNCEDIAMNYLVANYTGKAPIKVTPRKRFKCKGCTSESLWANPRHFVKRSECLNEFRRVYGVMPLKTVEFRADPLLFGEKLPDRMKMYRGVGTV